MGKKLKIVMIGMCLLLVGCQNTEKDTATENPKMTASETPKVTKALKTPETTETQMDNVEQGVNELWINLINTNYSPAVQIEGDDRDNQIIKDEQNILLPKSELIAIAGETNGSLYHFIDIPEDEVVRLITAIEESEIVQEDEVESDADYNSMGYADLILILQTHDNKSIILSLWTDNHYEKDIVRIAWRYENDTLYNPINGMFAGSHRIKSLNLLNMIRELAGYEIIDLKSLQGGIRMSAIKASYSEILWEVNSELLPDSKAVDNKKIEVDEDIIALILSGIEHEVNGRTQNHFVVPLKITCEDGREVDACFYNDRIAIGSTTYRINNELSNQLAEYFGERGLIDDYKKYLS